MYLGLVCFLQTKNGGFFFFSVKTGQVHACFLSLYLDCTKPGMTITHFFHLYRAGNFFPENKCDIIHLFYAIFSNLFCFIKSQKCLFFFSFIQTQLHFVDFKIILLKVGIFSDQYLTHLSWSNSDLIIIGNVNLSLHQTNLNLLKKIYLFNNIAIKS